MKLKHSLFFKIFLKFTLLLIIPTLILSIIVFSFLSKGNKEKTVAINRQIAEQISFTAKNNMSYVESMLKNLSSNNRLTTFLNTSYRQSIDFENYQTSIYSFVLGSAGIDYRNRLRIYMTNDTIPEGFGIFFKLAKIEKQSAVAEFLSSDKIISFYSQADFADYMKYPAIASPQNSIVCLRKVHISDKLTAIISMNMPEEQFFNSSAGYEVVTNGDKRILNFAKNHTSEIEETTFPKSVSGRTNNIDWYRCDIKDFPLEIIITNKSVTANIFFSVFNIFWLIFVICIAFLSILEIKRWTFKVYACLEQMKVSINQNFATRLPVKGKDEISMIAQNINLLLDKIKVLMEVTVKQELVGKQTQISVLQNQINPHFIYNTMEVFSAQMELYGHYDESEAMGDFANMLRYNVKRSNHYATVEQELSQVKSYLNIQKLRCPNVDLIIDISTKLYKQKVIRFLLQPFVENCIQHGMVNNSVGLRIFLSATVAEQDIVFTIYDNGNGFDELKARSLNEYFSKMDPMNTPDGDSIGLNNINHRLKLFYGDDYHIDIQTHEGKWSLITFKIPLLNDDDEQV